MGVEGVPVGSHEVWGWGWLVRIFEGEVFRTASHERKLNLLTRCGYGPKDNGACVHPHVARDADDGNSEQSGVRLADMAVKAGATDFLDEDGVRFPHDPTRLLVDLDADDADPQPRAGERLAPHELFR